MTLIFKLFVLVGYSRLTIFSNYTLMKLEPLKLCKLFNKTIMVFVAMVAELIAAGTSRSTL